ncbi:MAG: hypothetical protein GX628_09940 [Clostridiales bacterium]|mgnify:CR=1 FL=1|nr:hypothetical protein [Clostridiales bacterium]
MASDVFRAGAAREIITPPVGTALFGYAPDVISTSVHDDLTVTAAAFERGENRTILVSAALCELSDELADELREKIAAAAGIDFDEVIVCATHTHSGPTTVELTGWGPLNREYCDTILVPRAVKAGGDAWKSRIPAKMGIGTIESKVGINRRQITPKGEVILGQNPHGTFDPTMTILAFRGAEGNEPILNLVHYGCHGTAAGRNHEITRDWSGVMIDRLEAESGTMTVFFNGAIGDTGPRLTNGRTTGNIQYVRELGAVAAQDAVTCWRTIYDYRTDVAVKTVSGDISLPYQPLPPESEVDEQIAWFRANHDVNNLINLTGLKYDHLLRIKAHYESGAPAETAFTFRQTLAAIGPALFIPFPYEIFSAVTLRLREYSKFRHTLSLSCCNGAHAYFPSRDQIPLGGYEVMTSRAADVFNLTDDADNHIILQNLKLIESL